MTDNVQHQLDATRYPQLLINPEHIITYGVLGETKLLCNLPVVQSFRHKLGDFLFAVRPEVLSTSAQYREWRGMGQGIDDEIDLVTSGPNMPLRHRAHALAKRCNRFCS